jgi:hypothetical protein
MRIVRSLFALALLASAQDVLNNDPVVKMVKSGLGDGIVISMIQSQPGSYTLTPDPLVKLKQEGVSEKVLAAIIARGGT